MNITKWDDLLSVSVGDDDVKEWLWKADIEAEVSSEATDLMTITSSIFGCINKHSTSKEIQFRSYQLLHQICRNLDGTLGTEKKTSMNADIVQGSLRHWISHTDIVSVCLQYLAAASAEKHGDIADILPFDLLQMIFASMKAHRLSTVVQQPGTQIVLNLLSNTMTTVPMLDERILHKSILHVIYNLQFQRDDFLIIKACCSSLESIVQNTPLSTIAMYTDDILALTTETFHRYYSVVEVASTCLLTIEKLAVEGRHLLAFCPSSVQFHQLCESMQNIKNSKAYQQSFQASCSIMLRLVNAECVLSVLLDADFLTKRIFTKSLKGLLTVLFANIDVYYTNSLPQQQLEVLTSQILSKVDCWLNFTSNGSVTEKPKDSSGIIFGERLPEMSNIEIRVDEDKSDSVTDSFESKCVSVILNNSNSDNNDNSDRNEKNESNEKCAILAENIISKNIPSKNVHSTDKPPLNTTVTPAPLVSDLLSPSITNTTMIIKVVQESQNQAAIAIRRSDIFHSLFIEAAEKMEVLMRESNGLRSEIDHLRKLNTEKSHVNRYKSSNKHHDNSYENMNDIALEKYPVDLKRCDSPVSSNQKRQVLQGSSTRTLDKKTNRHDKLSVLGKSKSESESEFYSENDNENETENENEDFHNKNEDLGCSGVFFTQDQVDVLRGNINDSNSNCNSDDVDDVDDVDPYHTLHGSAANTFQIREIETRISLAAAGMIEALTVLTCENSIQTRYETALSDKVRRSLLQYGKGNMDPIQWGKYRVFRGHYYVGRDAVSAVIVENLACLIVHAFKQLKAYEMTSSCGLLRHSALGLAFLRVLLRNITVFQKRNIDILLKRLNVAYLSLSGVSYVLTALTVQRYPTLKIDALLLKLTFLLTQQYPNIKSQPQRSINMNLTPSNKRNIMISDEDKYALHTSFDREKAALQSIFNSYLLAPNYMITGSNIDRKKSPRRMLSFPCKVGSNHAFIESPSNSVKLDANICNGGTSSSGLHNLGGISLQGLNQFAMDFDLHPSLLPQSLLFEIFEDVIAGNSTKFRSNSSSSDGKSPSQSACIVSPDASWNSSSRKVQSPAADEVEPLLSLAQFQAVLVDIAIRSSYIRSLASDVLHAEEINSPPVTRKSFLEGNEEDGFALKEAKTQLNCLLTWLNESRGHERLADRLRSITTSTLSFKTVA